MVDDHSNPSFHAVVVVDDPHGLQDVRVVVELVSMFIFSVIRCC